MHWGCINNFSTRHSIVRNQAILFLDCISHINWVRLIYDMGDGGRVQLLHYWMWDYSLLSQWAGGLQWKRFFQMCVGEKSASCCFSISIKKLLEKPQTAGFQVLAVSTKCWNHKLFSLRGSISYIRSYTCSHCSCSV